MYWLSNIIMYFYKIAFIPNVYILGFLEVFMVSGGFVEVYVCLI